MKKQDIKAVIFDSGRVLNYPASGHWFITPNFWVYVDKSKFDSLDKNKVAEAFKKADKYIMTQKFIRTKEEEFVHFKEFYRLFSEYLPELQLNETAIKHIAEDMVYNEEKYVFYEDATEIIDKLYGKYKLAIISDAWPSLFNVYEKKSLTEKFNCIVISSLIGTTKPDAEMYLTALRKLEAKPDETVFVDDSPKNCLGAVDLGINTFLLCRNKQAYINYKIKSVGKGYKVINSLSQLEKYL